MTTATLRQRFGQRLVEARQGAMEGPGRWLLLGALFVVVVWTSLWSLASGAAAIPYQEVAATLLAKAGLGASAGDLQHEAIILHIRLPRLILGLVIGASLSCSGAVTQALFRNPLADPGLIGVLSGAALGASVMIVLGHRIVDYVPFATSPYAVSLAAFAAGLVTTAGIFVVARRGSQTVLTTLLLAGIAINAIVGALTGLLTYAADDEKLRSLTFWTLGSLGGATWETVATASPLIIGAVAALLLFARPLNAMSLGEAQARHLGVPVERIKVIALTLVALAVGAAVASAGMIGFVGLVIPHLLRLIAGPDHSVVLPGSALLGGALLVAADVVARTSVAPAELPIGILTAAIGGPFFLWLLMRERGRDGLW